MMQSWQKCSHQTSNLGGPIFWAHYVIAMIIYLKSKVWMFEGVLFNKDYQKLWSKKAAFQEIFHPYIYWCSNAYHFQCVFPTNMFITDYSFIKDPRVNSLFKLSLVSGCSYFYHGLALRSCVLVLGSSKMQKKKKKKKQDKTLK